MKKLMLIIVVFISIFAISCTEESVAPSQDMLNTSERGTSTAGGSTDEGPDIDLPDFNVSNTNGN